MTRLEELKILAKKIYNDKEWGKLDKKENVDNFMTYLDLYGDLTNQERRDFKEWRGKELK